jgi:hypothetical protein
MQSRHLPWLGSESQHVTCNMGGPVAWQALMVNPYVVTCCPCCFLYHTHRDLRKRVEELEGHVALLQGEGMAAALAAAEAQARTAQASVARKDSLIKALKERVDALTVRRNAQLCPAAAILVVFHKQAPVLRCLPLSRSAKRLRCKRPA